MALRVLIIRFKCLINSRVVVAECIRIIWNMMQVDLEIKRARKIR